ncbi:acyl-CoA N-acyltransferase [Periconia macrospinosa]|uniref:Acyl-CoA N-acyltransferase n=1 Tax=Periconia macrospinosa TaxID=97972 RepID=A0A2V1DMM5_9PLEO|nr:acyl-CoA N-acyltransferase [Periconia macrospinosa]
MHIRPLTRADLPSIAQISYQAFKDDELNAYLFPKQHEYPGDLRKFQLLRLRTRFVTQGMHGWVVVTDEKDGEGMWKGKEEVVGFASLLRLGDDEKAKRWQADSWSNALERQLLRIEGWYDATFVDRARSPSNMASFIAAAPWNDLAIYKQRWHLAILGVSPTHQRRGIGAMLVQHGQRLAADDGVPLTLESSLIGRRLYTKQGFRVVSEKKLAEGMDAVCMMWESQATGEGEKGE